MLDYQQVDPIELGPPETAATLNNDRLEPNFGLVPRPVDVNVRRFPAIARVEEESERTDSEYGGQ